MARRAILTVEQDQNGVLYLKDLLENNYQVPAPILDNVNRAYKKGRRIWIGFRVENKFWFSRVTSEMETSVNKFPELQALKMDINTTDNNVITSSVSSVNNVSSVPLIDNHIEFMNTIHSSYSIKPDDLFISEIKWKYLVRTVLHGKNILMEGPSGCGKTMTVVAISKAFKDNHPFYFFNLGSTQDPRSTLIGNTHFKKEEGTYFDESLFVKAIRTKNSIIMLDELSRAHPEAWNILMTVLDPNQRYLRLDEKEGSPTIKVADGVCFIATANIGNEYTSTRIVDRAIYDRFVRVEMEPLTEDQEFSLLQKKYPKVSKKLLKAVAEIADMTRQEVKQNNSKISTIISTRASEEIAGLLYDGFNLAEAAEVCIYPLYSEAGGDDSERSYVKQIVQKFIEDNKDSDLFNSNKVNSSF